MKNIMLPPALRSARKPMPTTAATARPYQRLTAASLIMRTAQASARRLIPTTVATERRFPFRATQPVLPTIPTVPPNVPLGAVTPGIRSRAIAASRAAYPVAAAVVREKLLQVVAAVV